MSGRSAATALRVVLVGAGAVPALAAESGYDVAADCPARQVWNEAVQARVPEPLSATDLQRFSVSIQRERAQGPDSFRYMGQLVPAGAAAGEGRTVNGASCPEVVEALSLIAALALRRTATRADPGLESPELEPTVAAPVFSAQDTPGDASVAQDPERLRLGLAGFVLLHSISAPQLATDLGVGVTLSWQSEHWQPWLLLGVYWGGERTRVQSGGAAARFDRWSTQVVGCPLRFPRQSAFGVRPCLSLDVGSLTGTGLGVNEATESAALLASSGVGLRLEWSVLKRLQLGADLEGVLTLTRPRFFFAPEVTALEVPALGLRSAASANFSF
jgi:hypothetical protein